MAGDDGASARALELLDALEREPWQFGFFQAVRLLDCAFADKPRMGESFRPSDDPIRFSQDPYTEFAPATLEGLHREGGGPPRLSQRFLGIFGPDGALPIHLTEYARDRARQNRDPTFARFADVFHHRMLSLYYRAWAMSQPVVQFDSPKDDRIAFYVGALIGLAGEQNRNRDAMYQVAKLGFVGHLSSLPRHVAGLRSLLQGYFEVPVNVTEFIAHWLKVPSQDHLLLGLGLTGHLGRDTVIGERVWQRQDKFRLTLGPLSLEDYSAFLPNGKSFAALVAAVQTFVGLELLWEVNLLLKKEEKPVTCLGKSGALGWTSWLDSEAENRDVDDLVLQIQNYVH